MEHSDRDREAALPGSLRTVVVEAREHAASPRLSGHSPTLERLAVLLRGRR